MTHTPAPEYETIAEDLARFLAKEGIGQWSDNGVRSEEHTSELQSR